MNTHTDKSRDNKSQSVAHELSAKKQNPDAVQVADNRPETTAQRKLQEAANNSTQVKQAAQLQAIANRHTTAPIQKKEEEEELQMKKAPVQKKENKTGLPDQIKSGVENLSGISLNDVKVHYNSAKPAQLQAHAYAQGTDIHVAPGQEKHLAHEAWHVVQQKQGRVKPTMQMKGNVNVNDDAGLEKEADEMGVQAITAFKPVRGNPPEQKSADNSIVQNVLQRQAVPGVAGFGNFVDLGNGLFGTTQPTDATEVSGLVNEIRTKAAAAGIHQNIKVLTGTHGDSSGHLVGETMFYTEDLAHEGHRVSEGGWINVMNVQGKSKDTIAGWMTPGTSAIILAWCYSKKSSENWENVHCYKTGADYHAGKKVW